MTKVAASRQRFDKKLPNFGYLLLIKVLTKTKVFKGY